MKKVILVLTAIAISAGAYAQSDSKQRDVNQRGKVNQRDASQHGDVNQRDASQRDLNQRDLNQHDRDYNQSQHVQTQNRSDKSKADGVMMKNGKVVKVENGQETTLNSDVTLSNGTRIMRDGNYTDRNGRTVKLEEGQHIDMSGNVSSLDKDEDRNMYLVPDSARVK